MTCGFNSSLNNDQKVLPPLPQPVLMPGGDFSDRVKRWRLKHSKNTLSLVVFRTVNLHRRRRHRFETEIGKPFAAAPLRFHNGLLSSVLLSSFLPFFLSSFLSSFPPSFLSSFPPSFLTFFLSSFLKRGDPFWGR